MSYLFADLRKADVPLWLVLIGLNIAYFTYLLGYTTRRGDEAELGTFRYIAPAYLLIVMAGVIRAVTTKSEILRLQRYRVWIGLYLGVVTIMVTRSLLSGVSLIQLFWETMPYLLVAVMFLGEKEEDWRLLSRVFVIHAFIACLYGVWLLLTRESSPSLQAWEARLLASKTDRPLVAKQLYAVPFLFLSYPLQSRLGSWVGVWGLVVLMLLAVFGQARSSFLSFAVLLGTSAFVWGRAARGKNPLRQVIIVFLIVLLLAGVTISSLRSEWGARSGFRTAWRGVMYRFIGKDRNVVEHTMKHFLWTEARFVMGLMSWDDWLMGKGVSGCWSHWRFYAGEERHMVHLGYLNLAFKGGIPLLVLFLFFPIVVGWRKLFTSRDALTLAAAGMIVQRAVGMIIAGELRTSLGLVLLFLCAGRCAADHTRPARGINRCQSSDFSRRIVVKRA